MLPARLVALAVVAGATISGMQSGAQFVTVADWDGRGTWLRADIHTHTQFSDGVQERRCPPAPAPP